MGIFDKKRLPGPVEHKTQHWDQLLYDRLFSSEKENQKIDGHRFSCELSKCRLEIFPGSDEPRKIYCGKRLVRLNEAKFCYIQVELEFFQASHVGDISKQMFDSAYGFACFDNDTTISVRVKNTNRLSEQVARAYFESKATGNTGIVLTWRMILSPMIGLSANEVWGDWVANSFNQADTSNLSGLRNFSLESISFSSTI